MNESVLSLQMEEIVKIFSTDIAGIRTGRASPAIVSDLKVAVYGGQQRLKVNELANITSPDPATITITPWDRSIAGEIRKGILAANVGLSPILDGEVVRINLSPLTTEDREKYARLVSDKEEAAKVMIRQVRGEALKEIRKAFEERGVTEDEKFRLEKKLQELTDEFTEKLVVLSQKKKAELMTL